jgi:hypothetical protein
MRSVTKRSPSQIMRSRGIGALVGTLIGGGWMAYGLLWFPDIVRVFVGLVGLVAVVILMVASRRLVACARNMPAPNAAAQSTNRRVWTLFWINFVVEIALLNVAIALLASPALHVYWIPAISFVVGLHFLPMARFFSVPSYFVCGAVMIGVAGTIALVLRSGVASPELYAAGEALVNAAILWSTVAWGISNARSTQCPT